MTRDLGRTVVVITGASSGIGRVAGHAFAQQGSRLELGARSEGPLQAVAAECVHCATDRRRELAHAFAATLRGAARGVRGG